MVLFLRNKRFNVTLFLSDYQLRRWRLPIEERACRKTRLGGGDYPLRTSALLPPPPVKRSPIILFVISNLPESISKLQNFCLKL